MTSSERVSALQQGQDTASGNGRAPKSASPGDLASPAARLRHGSGPESGPSAHPRARQGSMDERRSRGAVPDRRRRAAPAPASRAAPALAAAERPAGRVLRRGDVPGRRSGRGLTYTRQQREVEDSVGTQLLNIARVAALQLDPRLHAEVGAAADPTPQASEAPPDARRDPGRDPPDEPDHHPHRPPARRANRAARPRQQRAGPPGRPLSARPRAGRAHGLDARGRRRALHARLPAPGGLWISAFAPILDPQGRPAALLHVAYPVEIYLDRLHELRNTLLFATGWAALALVRGLLVLRRLTRPIALLTGGVSRVAAGDLSKPLPVRRGTRSAG